MLGWKVGAHLGTRAELIGAKDHRRYLEIGPDGTLTDQLYEGGVPAPPPSSASEAADSQGIPMSALEEQADRRYHKASVEPDGRPEAITPSTLVQAKVYFDAFKGISDSCADAIDRFASLGKSPQWNDQNWRTAVLSQISVCERGAADLERLQPPAPLRAAHAKWLSSFDVLREAGTEIRAILETGDGRAPLDLGTLARKATELGEEGNRLMHEAIVVMNKAQV